ncbi:MAG: hypothetical protein IJ693_06470 [Bacteroidaceae bacterium]|nr:hypothetical protein [Bacteroidaceae bacterium]
MKKILFVLAAASMTMAAQAKILRVSNVAGSSAPYTSVKDAIGVAEEGDTIMLDGSATNYGNVEISKRVVLIGPGYLLGENGIVDEAAPSAVISNLTVTKNAPNTVIKGIKIISGATINGPKTIVTRCMFTGDLNLGAVNTIVHQNFFYKARVGTTQFYLDDYNMQITNNIIYGGIIRSIGGSYIAYNTIIFENTENAAFSNIITSAIEHNIMPNGEVSGNGWNDTSSNNFSDNLEYKGFVYKDISTDMDVQSASAKISEDKYGAFAGEDPYVLSGVPSGPVIQDLVVPASVEKGSTMSVTVKVGVVK